MKTRQEIVNYLNVQFIFWIKSFSQIDKNNASNKTLIYVLYHLSVMFISEVNVECICLKPDWTKVMRLFSPKKVEKCMSTNLSITLDRTGRIDIGL